MNVSEYHGVVYAGRSAGGTFLSLEGEPIHAGVEVFNERPTGIRVDTRGVRPEMALDVRIVKAPSPEVAARIHTAFLS